MLARSSALIASSVVFVGLTSFVPVGRGDDLYLGLNHAALFSRCGIEVKHTLFAKGVIYEFGEPVTIHAAGTPYGPLYVDSIAVSVQPSVDGARRLFREQWIAPLPPPPPPPGDAIGDEMVWGWSVAGPNSPSANITFRRGNVVINVRQRGEAAGVVALARQIDTLIRDDREIAPLGTFDPAPEIVDAGISTTLTVRPMMEPVTVTDFRGTREFLRNPFGTGAPPMAFVTIQPQFRGLGDLAKLRLRVVQPGGYDNLLEDELAPAGREFPPEKAYHVPTGPDRVGNVRAGEAAAAGVDGRFILRVGVPDAPRVEKFIMIAASEHNVIVTKEVEVRIERGQ